MEKENLFDSVEKTENGKIKVVFSAEVDESMFHSIEDIARMFIEAKTNANRFSARLALWEKDEPEVPELLLKIILIKKTYPCFYELAKNFLLALE